MKYHIALSRSFDLESIIQNAQAGKCPNHVMWDISKHLGATIYQPGVVAPSPLDKILAKIYSRPGHWALVRKLLSQLKGDDLIFCTGEDVGFLVAMLFVAKQDRPKIVVNIMNAEPLRNRLALKLFGLADRIDLFITQSHLQADLLRRKAGVSENRICVFMDQPTDTSFFTPGSASPDKRRPVIGSGGLEQRDYRTLANATQDLDVDVRICAFSPDAATQKRAFPEVMPSNMSCRFYDWGELVQLYRDSDLVVLSLFENNYQAGLSTLFEAMACRRPVVVTRLPGGIIDSLIDSGFVTGVNLGDAVGMRQAIVSLLNDPEKAEAQAQRGYELVLKQYNYKKYIEGFVTELTSRYGSPLNSASVS